MDMSLLRRGLHLTMHGGTGGDGGQGGGQGGQGGVGEGPVVNLYGDKEEERRKIVNWLSPINFFLRQAAILEMWDKGTGGWLLEHPLFKGWESGLGSTLWCCGIPGAGKTVLASMVVNHLSTQSKGRNSGVACIYLNHKEVDNQTPSKLLAGLWQQLVLHRDIGPITEDLYKQHQEKSTAPSLEEVVNVLNSSLEMFSQVFIIVDAMDEYPDFQRKILLEQLAAMGSSVNLMITSRPNISLEPELFPNLERLDIRATEDDLRKYVDTQIELSPRLNGHVTKQYGLREEIYSKINSRTVDGMFLLAKLHIQSLSTKNTIKAVQEAMKKLPNSLDDSYDIAMQRIDDQTEEDRKTAHSTLIWVANAKQPLTESELIASLAIETEDRQLDEDNVLDIQIIISVCAGLVIVDSQSSVVRLVHYTTQEYLDKIQAEKFPSAQTEITRTLLTFLAFDGYPDSSWKSGNLPPLAGYSQYCLAHAAGQSEFELRDSLLEFLNQALNWKQTMRQRWNSEPWNYPYWPSQPSALWIAVAANLVETVKFLLKKQTWHPENSMIIVASYYGHTQIVCMLLEKGARINAAEGHYGSPLQAAAVQGHTEIVGMLLEKGANIDATGGFYGSPLQAAIVKGHTEMVHMLLEKGANVNAAGGHYGSPLQAAAARGVPEIVYVLLEKGARINAAGGHYGSPLQAAAVQGHPEIVHMLLERGANVNATGGFYGSPLQAAIVKGHTELVHVLLEKGASIDAAGGRYGSSLQAAAAHGHTKIFGMLLEKGANINAAGGEYGSPLQAAAARGVPELVQVLLEKGARINVTRGHYGSSLQAAAADGHTDIVCMLLENGAMVNATGGFYRSSLQAAIVKGHTEIVRMLLEKGAHVDTAWGFHGSPLQTAVVQGHPEIVGMLLEKGANVDETGGDYGSALRAAIVKGHTEIVHMLLEEGANIDTTGGFHGSALRIAIVKGHTEIVHMLLEKGANINATGGFYGSPLQAAIVEGHTEVVHMLLEKGANINATGGDYGSPLQAAIVKGHIEIAHMLLEMGANDNTATGEHGSLLQAT